MNRTEAFKYILEGKAILITGSGAHVDVRTPNNDPFPSGITLASNIYKLCGIDNPENKWDLQDATDTYIEMFSEESLVQEIQKQLMVGTIKEEHQQLYSCNWQRVYTTNYDEVPRCATSKNSNTLIPITLSTERSEKDLEKNLCIYINGYIGKLKPETLRNEFKLTGRSYLAAEELIKSEWGEVFSEDIETAECIVIIGLSLEYDLEIKRFIYSKNVEEKIIFITSPDLTQDKKRKMERIGKVETIGMKQFVDELVEFRKTYVVPEMPKELFIYKSFDPYMSKMNLKRASSINVYDLFMSGEQNDNLWYRSKGKYTCIIYREKIKEVIKCLQNGCKTIYLHANLGNGKTMFIESLKHQLQRFDYKIFTLKEYYQKFTEKEIKNIVDESGKKIVVIENYYNYISVIKHFSIYNLEDIQFIFSARTVLYDTRLAEVDEMLKIRQGESVIFDLNKLSKTELFAINKIMEDNGLWGEYSSKADAQKRKLLSGKENGNRELQAILVGVLNSTSMKQKIEDIVKDIKKLSGDYYDVLILALLIKTMSLNISANDMSRILGVNIALDAIFVNNASVKEILDFSSGDTEFRLRSAVTAKMILKELDCNEEIIRVLSKTAKYANQYRKIERYENILKNIISYSHVRTFLMSSSQKEMFLINYYNDLKELEYYKENSFYWLQYSIACTNIGKYDLAQTYLDNAYTWFRGTEEIVPFQMDTQQARLYLLLIEQGLSSDTKKDFLDAHNLLMKPVVSSKDNPAKQISLFSFYLKKAVRDKVSKVDIALYQRSCGEAYNKVSQYLKNVRVENDKERFRGLSRNLLRCCTPKEE